MLWQPHFAERHQFTYFYSRRKQQRKERAWNYKEWYDGRGGKFCAHIAGNINLMNYFLTFVVSTDGACINEAFTSLDVWFFFYKIQIMNCLANENIYWKPINLQDTSVHVRILPTEDKSYNIGKYPTFSVFLRWWFRWRVWSCCIQWFLPGVLLGSNYGSSQY